jgi:hypothetical protein
MMLARKLPYFNTKTLTLNLANLELGEGFRDFSYACGMKEKAPLGKTSYSDQKHQKQGNFPSFFFKVPFIYLFFEIFDFMACNDGK